MKLTKKQENEIWQVYNTWLHGYLNGDVKTYKKYLDKAYHFIGSTGNEEFLNKKDTTNFFKETSDQLAGKCDLRNEIKIIEKFEGLVFVTHLFDAWFKNGNDFAYYGRFRFTNALKKNNVGWRFIYQHFSTTDSKTDDGETIGFNKVNLENQELREAIKRRTFELEQKNRELEIETALERIRAQAVAMKASSDLLDIVVSMRNEFINLGHEAHYFWHMMWLPKTYEKAMTSGDGSKIGFVMELPRHIHGNIPLLAKWEKSKKPTVVYTMNVEEAIDYVDKMVSLGNFKNIDPQAPTHEDIMNIGGLTYIMARTSHGEIGYSLPGIVKNPPKEDVDILLKFAGAFDLAHQRFLDLQKAEKRTRETLIELSLERIRSRVTAMQESSDLFDIVVTMRNEFLSLGHEADYFWHMKWTKDNYEMSMTAEDGGRLGMVITVPKFVHEEIKSLHKWEKGNSPYFVLALNGKEAWKYIDKMNTYGKYQQVDPHAPTEEDILHIGGLTFIIARTTHGEIGFSLAGKVDKPPKASIDILVRFASVFDLAYKRFEDLQNSEAQARETQIELALEKVRSRTMAMQHSNELQETSFLLDEQIRALGIKTWGCAFNIYGDKASTEWFGNEAGVLPTYTVPHKGIFKKYYQKGQKGESFFIQEFSGKACIDHYEYMSTLPVIGDVLKTLKKTNKGFPNFQIDHVAYFKYGYLLFITKEHVPESHEVFKRFAKVFEQTYTRFLDLQKAEAQAREAQIETALERVRSRSIGMYKSEELAQVVLLLDEELIELGVEVHGTQILTDFDNPENNVKVWFGMKGQDYLERFHVPYFDHPIRKNFHSAWKKGVDFFTEQYSKTDKNKFIRLLFKNSDFRKASEERQKFIYDSPGLTRASVLFKNSILIFQRYNLLEFSDEEVAIFKRFSKVFEQAYTRFLDLQKAEAQAREALIEASLERIRSRSMAMQKSSELLEAGELLWNEITKLGIECFTSGYVLMDAKDDVGWNYTPNPSTGKILDQAIGIPHKQTPPMKKIVAGWKKQKPLCVIDLNRKQTIAHQTFVAENGINFPFSAKQLVEISPKEIVLHTFNFKQGYLLIVGGEKLAKAQIDLMLRFTKVFQQTYTRFLDLKKAESQAREAQIEATLERVRSRSMAMHHSNEIGEVAFVLFEQLKSLGGELWGTGFGFCEPNSNVDEFWFANEKGIMPHLKIPNTQDPVHKKMYQGWKKNLELFSIAQGGKELKDHYKYMLTIPDLQPIFQGMLDDGIAFPKWQKWHAAYFKYGYLLAITTEPYINEDIFKRFAKVFEQAYARFLDLQKAEAQAKEAQIEMALEKVRSRTMAMQHSEELPEAANVLFMEIQNLGIPAWSCGYNILSEDKKSSTCFMSSEGEIQAPFVLPFTKHKSLRFWHKALLNNEPFFVHELGGEDLVAHYDFMQSLPDLKETFQQLREADISLPTFQVNHLAKFTNGFLLIITYERVPDAHEIFQRFAKVFNQTYTRFLDLKKAEAQTREAQINLAVERVRAKALAMHKSEEIMEVVAKLKDEVMSLDIPDVVAATIFLKEGDDQVRMWDLSTLEKNNNGYQIPFDITFKLKKKDPYLYVKRVWENPDDYFLELQEAKDFKRIIAWLRENNKEAIADEVEEYTETTKLKQLHHAVKKLDSGKLVIDLLNPPTDEMKSILTKMGAAFDLAYKRFEDLQKAEAQTREAQIEAALEKVRSRSLAMHKPDELQEVVAVVAEKLQELGVIYDAGGVILCTYFPDNKDVVHWIAVDDFSTSGRYFVPYFDNPIFSEAWDSKIRGDAYFSKEFSAEAKNHFFKYAFEHSDYKHFPEDYKEHVLKADKHNLSAAWSKNSAIIIPSLTGLVPSESDAVIMQRFAKVFEQAYIRFMDLQKAEERARETQIDSALERVRSRAMAMHQSDELSEAAEMLYQEFYKLGVTPFSCGYLINDDTNEAWKVWMTDANDETFKNFWTLPYNADHHLRSRFKSWKNKDVFHSSVLEGDENINHHKVIAKYAPWKQESMGELPNILVLSSAHFTHGHLLIVTGEKLTKEEESILTRFATVFDQTYIRFLDLKKAEHQTLLIKEEKERLEVTINDLRATQKQLIQSEKMASLGELTAGIAHEIQNPLNFVNNFSEVSKELLEEMLEEMENGDMEEVKAIMDDVTQNLEKINHHGKRADGIVKGMLQHSRASGDKKELTDINALADEYLRLAYHGLRAKDQSFNAQLVTDFDKNISTVNVIPQDLGRVILNLLTNAFYAVNEKKKSGVENYEPTVSISTKKIKETIEIKVTDNGNGISNTIKEKVFQPFFTTKPTGQGTGLGLSMSYDIITKGHGGELKVDTKEGKGTIFTINLKMND